jgi:hypothetical protein
MLLVGVVGVSAVAHWLAVRPIHGPWIVPDEMVYAARGLDLWHHGPLPLFRGSGAGYGLFYPLVAGLPLSVGRTTQGYELLKLVQPLIVSLAAVPVYVYGRRIMPAVWAIVAAGLTCASPLLLYSGFVMTEVLFYPLAAVTLLAFARAIETGSRRHQLIAIALTAAAVLTRSQAVVLAVVLPLAALLDATMSRSWRRLRAFWPSVAVFLVALAALVAFPGLVGAYGETLRGGYPLSAALRLVLDHLAYVALSVAVLPFVALISLAVDAFRGRERSAAARALLAVTLAATGAFTVEVGFFAARYSPHVLGRDLAALPPLLFTTFALWLSRGARRTIVAVSVAGYTALAVVLLVPELVRVTAFPDSFDLIALAKLPGGATATLIIFSTVVLLGFILLPRRVAVVALPATVLVALIGSSVVAAHELRHLVGASTLDAIGRPPDWIDRAVHARVAYVYGGEQYWNVVWQERFWNRSIDNVITLGATPVPGPMKQTIATLAVDGKLPTRDRYAVAPDRFVLDGTPVAHLAQQGLDVSGLTLWRLDGSPRVSTIVGGVQPNGDITHPATVSVYDCRRGQLELTLIPKATTRLRIKLGRHNVVDEPIAGLSWTRAIPVPASTVPRVCTFTIYPEPLLGSTRITFTPS